MLKKFLIILITVSCIMTATVITSYSNKEVTYKNVQVERGQTLWNIAKNYSGHEKDPRKLVYQIKKINNIDNSILQPGQIIRIPINNKS